MADNVLEGLSMDWQCPRCGTPYPSRWAADVCAAEDDADDREVRKRCR